MAKPYEIIRDQAEHFILRIISRSALLNYRKTRTRIDLPDLFEGVLSNAPMNPNAKLAKVMPVSKPEELIHALLKKNPSETVILNPTEKIMASCRMIQEAADDYRNMTGQHSLFVGYPLIFSPKNGTGSILAPLFLWPVEVRSQSGKVFIGRREDEDEPGENGTIEPPIFNALLAAWLYHEREIVMKCADSTLEELCLGNLAECTTEILKVWPGFRPVLDVNFIEHTPSSADRKAWISQGSDPRLLSAAILGNSPFKGQALLDDLQKIEQFARSNPQASLGMLDNYIRPKSTGMHGNVEAPSETNKWTVTSADNSQERAIWQQRESDHIVIQGPPGTGKSQTIVNLVADAVKHGKTVAVICQKDPALQVVAKRLDACGLGNLYLKIDDLEKNRAAIVRGIRDTDSDFQIPRNLQKDRERLARSIEDCETILNRVNETLGPTAEQVRPRFGDILGHIHKREDVGYKNQFEYRPFIRALEGRGPNDWDELLDHLRELEEFIQAHRRSQFPKNPWRGLKDVSPSFELERIIGDLLAEMRIHGWNVKESGRSGIYPSHVAWCVEPQSARASFSAFLPPQDRESLASRAQLRWVSKKLLQYLSDHLASEIMNKLLEEEDVVSVCDELIDQFGHLKQVSYVRQQMENVPAFAKLESRFPLKYDDWSNLASLSALTQWRDQILRQCPLPSTDEIEGKRRQLKDALARKREHDCKDVSAAYSERIEPRNELQERRLLTLRRSKNAPRTTLRALHEKGWDELHKLYPITLTSPDVACSLFPLEAELIDLLIIDEASQMFVAEAIPLLFRAKSVVISGDDNQMPPSDFFDLAVKNGGDGGDGTENEDDSESTDETEKKADENRLIAADGEYVLLTAAEHAIPKGSASNLMLRVHYRSEFRELIEFSNQAFYKGELQVPEGNRQPIPLLGKPIALHQINGEFTKERVNPQEAHAVVDFLIKLLFIPLSKRPSIGVIAFNIAQAELIQEILAEKIQQDERLFAVREEEKGRYSSDGTNESLFIRNVENVQGEERDLIIFSTTYGARNRNYGPISRKEKGRKRLNVAITRAKKGVAIFTSLDIDRMLGDSDNSDSENIYFWKYLGYARAIDAGDSKSAQSILQSLPGRSETPKTRTAPESVFEEDVADFLISKGYHVDYQIGVEGFRIDLGVKGQARNRNYVCGIECDGRIYHSSWGARLNDVWRQGVLEAKGWKIVRVWSTDWYHTPETAKRKLLEELHACSQSSLFGDV